MQYFIFILIFAFFVFLSNSTKRSKESTLIYYLFVFLVAMAVGLKGNYDEYTRLYILIPSLDDFFSGNYPVINEKGWLFGFISSVFITIGLSSQSLFLFFASLAVFIHAIYFRKYTKYYFLAFLIYLSHEILFKEMIGIRMGFASALLLPMIYYLDTGKKIKFFLIALVATFVQYVAALSLFLYFLNYRIKPIYLWIGLILSLILSQSGIIHNIIMWLDSANYLPSIVSNYIGYESYVYDTGVFSPKLVQQVVVIVVLISLFGYKQVKFRSYNLLFNAYYLGTIFYILFSEFALFAFRFNAHFYSVEPILITYILTTFKQRKLILNIVTIIMIMIAYLNLVVIERIPAYDLFVNYPL